MRQVAVELPDDVARQLEVSGQDLARRTLEALAFDAYRSGEITTAQVQEMLHHSSRWETEAFLKERQAYLHYGEADLDADMLAIHRAAQP
jgi:predicted HTH domain antitoxin